MAKIDEYQQTLTWLDGCYQPMHERLLEWSEINSGSFHLDGLSTMHQQLTNAFSVLKGDIKSFQADPLTEISVNGETITRPLGDGLLITMRPEKKRQILLTGHMDTVFSEDHAFQTVTKLDDNRLNGPGVSDMKGGLLVMLYALQALEQSPYAEEIGWQVLINADEEIGSLGSAPMIEKVSQGKTLGLVYEPCMDDKGLMASRRKGSGKFTIKVKGLAAHAGRDFESGRNAIVKLSQLIGQIHELNGRREGVTINIGIAHGGSALNAVPDTAIARLDVRIMAEDDSNWVLNQLDTLIDEANQEPDYTVTRHGGFSRPVKLVDEKSQALMDKVKAIGEHLSIPITYAPLNGGCCDGNNISACGVPVLDTLGVRGGLIHSDREYICLDSLVERAKLSALLLMEFARGEV